MIIYNRRYGLQGLHACGHIFRIVSGLMQNLKSNRFSRFRIQGKQNAFNRKYSKHTSLEIKNYKIGGYFGQRSTISKRKVNETCFPGKLP